MIRAADVSSLRDVTSVQLLQDQTHLMLQEHSNRNAAAPMTGRFAKLLLLLPSLKAVSSTFIGELFFRPLVGDAIPSSPISRLLVDL